MAAFVKMGYVDINGDLVRKTLEKKGLTLTYVEKIMGARDQSLSNWTRRGRMEEKYVDQLCVICDISKEDLLNVRTGSEVPEKKPEPAKAEKKVEPKMETDGVLKSIPNAYTPSEDLHKFVTQYMADMRDLIAAERKENAELRALLKEAIGAINTKTQDQAIEIGHISMELCDYGFRQFKKQATEKANLVMSRHKEYKSTNSVWSDVYKLLRAEYGVVWEQEKKEFLEVNGYSPASTLQLCYWIEANKPTYHNLFMSKLDTLANAK